MAFAVDFPNQYAYFTVIFNFCQETIMARIHSQEVTIRLYRLIPDAENPEEESPPQLVLCTEARESLGRVIRHMFEDSDVFVEITHTGAVRYPVGTKGSTLA